jgi:MFS transporter, DHA1 family, multidrug resistance protein
VRYLRFTMRNTLAPTKLPFEAVILGGFAVMGPIATDTFAPVMPAVARDLAVGSGATQLTLTTFLVALGVGQVVIGPLSDTFGRRAPLLIGCVLYAAAGLVAAFAGSILVLCLARLLQGAAAAAGVAVSRAIVRDLYDGLETARAFARLFFVLALSPVVGPIVGTQILHAGSWRGVFVLLSLLGAVLWIVAAFALPETLSLERRTPSGIGRSLRTMRQLVRDPQFTGYAIPLGCGTAALVTMVGGAPFVVEDGYGRSPDLYAAIFVACAIAMTAVTLANGALLRRFSSERLLLTGVGSLTASGLVLLTLGGHALWAFGLCFGLVFATWGLIAANATTLALGRYAAVAGTAAALVGCVQYATGALVAPLGGAAGGSPAALGVLVTVVGTSGCLATAWATRRAPRMERSAPETPPGAATADVGIV